MKDCHRPSLNTNTTTNIHPAYNQKESDCARRPLCHYEHHCIITSHDQDMSDPCRIERWASGSWFGLTIKRRPVVDGAAAAAAGAPPAPAPTPPAWLWDEAAPEDEADELEAKEEVAAAAAGGGCDCDWDSSEDAAEVEEREGASVRSIKIPSLTTRRWITFLRMKK